MFIIGKPRKPEKNLINFRTKPARKDEKAKEPFDLDRVVWDPAYRRSVCDALNRPSTKGTKRRRPRQRAS